MDTANLCTLCTRHSYLYTNMNRPRHATSSTVGPPPKSYVSVGHQFGGARYYISRAVMAKAARFFADRPAHLLRPSPVVFIMLRIADRIMRTCTSCRPGESPVSIICIIRPQRAAADGGPSGDGGPTEEEKLIVEFLSGDGTSASWPAGRGAPLFARAADLGGVDEEMAEA
jgi:hypothetical protein